MKNDARLEDAKNFVRSVLVSRFNQKVDEKVILETAKKVVSRSALGSRNTSQSDNRTPKQVGENVE